MPTFEPGQQVTANITLSLNPPGVEATALLQLVNDEQGQDQMPLVASIAEDWTQPLAVAGQQFISTGSQQTIQLPITMPGTGRYTPFLDILIGGQTVRQFVGTEFVDVAMSQELALTIGPMLATRVTVPSTSSYTAAQLACTITNPHPVQVTRRITLMWADWSKYYNYWNCPGGVQDPDLLPLRGCSERYNSVCDTSRCQPHTFDVTLAPWASYQYAYSGMCQPVDMDWEVGVPALFIRHTFYFFLRDDLGNRGADGVIET